MGPGERQRQAVLEKAVWVVSKAPDIEEDMRRIATPFNIPTLALVALALLSAQGMCFAGDAQTKDDEKAGAAVLTGAGTTLLWPEGSEWVQPYYEYSSDKFVYLATGSASVPIMLANGSAEFGASILLSPQVARTQKLLQIPWMASSFAVVYSLPTVSKPLRLTPDVIAAIYLGQIRLWNDPRIAAINPGTKLPGLDILVMLPFSKPILDAYLTTVSSDWRHYRRFVSPKWPTGLSVSQDLAAVIKENRGAICLIDLVYAKVNGCTCAMIKNQTGTYIAPDLDSVNAATEASATSFSDGSKPFFLFSKAPNAYPIVFVTYFVVPESKLNGILAENLLRFFDWTRTGGKQIANNWNMSTMPDAAVQRSESDFKSRFVKTNSP